MINFFVFGEICQLFINLDGKTFPTSGKNFPPVKNHWDRASASKLVDSGDFPHLIVVDRWPATPKRACIALRRFLVVKG